MANYIARMKREMRLSSCLTANATVAAAATVEVLATPTLYTTDMVVGLTVTCDIAGVITSDAAPLNHTINFRYGSTDLATILIDPDASSVAVGAMARFVARVHTLGSGTAGKIVAAGWGQCESQTTASTEGAQVAGLHGSVAAGVNVDTTLLDDFNVEVIAPAGDSSVWYAAQIRVLSP